MRRQKTTKQAVAARERAGNRAREYAEPGNYERRWREVDAVIATLSMTQAAAESWVNWAYAELGVHPQTQRWIERWRAATTLLPQARGSEGRDLSPDTMAFLAKLSAWRNFLMHGDQTSRDRLVKYVPAGDEGNYLKADLADWAIQGADAAFSDAGGVLGVYGIAGLHSAFSWVAADEL
jgi:hypothetical protein